MKIFAKISFILFSYYLAYYTYLGLSHPVPALGDSWDYHIPISQSILNGTFIQFHSKMGQQYYPGSSEAINSLLMLLHIPLTLSNLLAIVVLFFCLWKLALSFKLDYYTSLFFSSTFCTLTVIVRWFNAVSIDVWVAVFFTLAIIFLRSPQKTRNYFFILGCILGMLVGSKYTAWVWVLLLLGVYGKKILPFVTFSRLVSFLIPFSLLGLFWYIRNFFSVGNPFYPLCLFRFPCQPIFGATVVSTGIQHPIEMFNAFFSEYTLWMFSPLVLLWYFFQKTKKQYDILELSILGFVGLLFYLFFPTSSQPWIMVSSLRYSFPLFIPFILSMFLLAKHYKKEALFGYIAIACTLPTLSMTFYPKLIFLYVPFAFVCFHFIEKYTPQNGKKTQNLIG